MEVFMKLVALPAFTDNYIWLLHDDQHALVVDPGSAHEVLHWLEKHPGIQLEHVLVTHHHGDHTGGIAQLLDATHAKVHAPATEPANYTHHAVSEGEYFRWHGASLRVLQVPGHTAGHIAWVVEIPDQDPILFCGDTLFSAGCGRVFEGTPEQMHASLQKLAQLPGRTRVCPAHEYTLSNLRFAQTVECQNTDLAQHTNHCQRLRAQHQPTLPSTMALELKINPFLRVNQASVRASALQRNPHIKTDAEAFAALREWKNQF
jgi:hydroxyacylglutathione hydrolase